VARLGASAKVNLIKHFGVAKDPGRHYALTDQQTMIAALTKRQQAGWTQETVKVLAVHPEGSDVLDIVHYEIQGTGAQAGK
jgi:hypothetical protein